MADFRHGQMQGLKGCPCPASTSAARGKWPYSQAGFLYVWEPWLLTSPNLYPCSIRGNSREASLYPLETLNWPKSHQNLGASRFATTWMKLEIIILSEVSQRKTNTIWYHLSVESNTWHKWAEIRHTTKQKKNQGHREQMGGCQGEAGIREGWIESLGLADANWYVY